MKKSPIIVFKHDSCDGCKEIIPIIKRMAKKKKIPVKIIDVEKCKDKKKCDSLKYVPYIEYENREIKTSKDLDELFGTKKN